MRIIHFILIFLAISGCRQVSTADQTQKQNNVLANSEKNTPAKQTPDILVLQKLFQLTEAERILGEDAYLNDSSISINKNATVYQCSYIADARDEITGKTGAIYYMVEYFGVLDSAKHIYAFFKKVNQEHGIKTIDGLGDEAYFHSDNQNFLMIIARKENRVLRMKVNKITSHTSTVEFHTIARDIVSRL